MGMVEDLANEIMVDEDDRLAVSLSMLNEGLVNGAYSPIGEGLSLCRIVKSCAPQIEENENLAYLVAILVRSIWGNDALRTLVALRVNRGEEGQYDN